MSKAKPTRGGRTSSQAPPSSQRAPTRAAQSSSAPPTVSARWLLGAIVASVIAALLCAWGTLCLLFWQGSWQLLYHPTSAVTRTPASVNLPFDSIGFGTNASGEPQLRGWWIPATSPARYSAIFLHGANGNLGDTISALAPLHAAGLNIFAFDYRGYGQSHFTHPSERRWREDADSAISYLTGTRHIPVDSIILVGKGLGANLALEVAAAHPDLAGIVLEQPLASPTTAIFNDARAHLVPARLLVSDRWEANAAASNLLVPSLWFCLNPEGTGQSGQNEPAAYGQVSARKMLVWLNDSPDESRQFSSALRRWLDQLSNKAL